MLKQRPFAVAFYNDLGVLTGFEDRPLSPETVLVLGAAQQVKQAIIEELNGLSRRAVGRIVGAIAFEVALAYGTGGLAAAAKAGKFSKLTSTLNGLTLPSGKAGKILNAVKDAFTNLAKTRSARTTLTVLNKTCFVAGTPILTPDGYKLIQEFKAGDAILSRPEDQPGVPVRPGIVEEFFKLSAPILELRLGGQTIQTTAEHPFYVVEEGWVRAEKLKSGDQLVGHDSQLTAVESVTMTDRHETVYNVRVAEDHTYFVGAEDWSFSVWVHNTYSIRKLADGTFEVIDGAGVAVRSGLDQNTAEGLARLFGNLPVIKRAKPSKLGHAADQAVERLGLERSAAMKQLREIVKKLGDEGIPPGSLLDPGNEAGVKNRVIDSILVPFEDGAAVFQIKNGSANLMTVLSESQFLSALERLGF